MTLRASSDEQAATVHDCRSRHCVSKGVWRPTGMSPGRRIQTCCCCYLGPGACAVQDLLRYPRAACLQYINQMLDNVVVPRSTYQHRREPEQGLLLYLLVLSSLLSLLLSAFICVICPDIPWRKLTGQHTK